MRQDGKSPARRTKDQRGIWDVKMKNQGLGWGALSGVALTISSLIGASVWAAKTRPCGTEGSIVERARKCGQQVRKGKSAWTLVTRTSAGTEVWRDDASGLLWSDRLGFKMDRRSAERVCASENRASDIKGELSARFRLPALKEFTAAEKRGLRKVLPKMDDDWFWTSSSKGLDADGMPVAYVFDAVDGKLAEASPSDPFGTVRCVAELK